VDVTPIAPLTLGGSIFLGNTGQDRSYDTNADGFDDVSLPDARLALWEVHAELATHGLRARALYTMGHLSDAGDLTRALGPTVLGGNGDLDANANGLIDTGEVIASQTRGYYGEVGYEIFQWLLPDSGWTLEPFVRAEWIDTQFDVPSGFDEDRSRKFRVVTTGIQAKPIPNVVFKIDYRNRSARSGELGDEVNAGLGLVF
jgi:hypothetical protein